MPRAMEYSDGSGWSVFCPACQSAHKFRKGVWTFSGNLEIPTFSPSMLVRGALRSPTRESLDGSDGLYGVCHSFVTNGKIQFLSDCTHTLAGQVVDLPDFAEMSKGVNDG